MANNDIPYMDWQSSNLTQTFKLFKQQLELFFVVNKIKIEQQVNYILLRVGNEGLKKYNTWLLTEEKNVLRKLFLISSLNNSNLKKISY